MLFKKNKIQDKVEDPQIQNGNGAEVDSAVHGKTKVYNLVILDKSGSMSSIANAAVAGFNETVGGIRSAQERYHETQEHYVSLFAFCNCDKSYIYENAPVGEVKNLTSREYKPCCCTPLYDAMGISLNKLLKQIQQEENATAVVTVITDGMENASQEYSGQAIQALVDKLKNEEGWNFAYIGTNQDVEAVSMSLHIENHLSFDYNEEGMSEAWRRERNAKQRIFDRLNEEAPMCCEMAPQERKRFWSRRNSEEQNFLQMKDVKDRVAPDLIDSLKDNEIFVFGSNLAGAHGGGAAYVAVRKFGAVMGQGVGLQGQSYAIPTMQGGVETIQPYVDEFVEFAKDHPQLTFLVTRIGCGIAGFTDQEIASLFVRATRIQNIHLPLSFWNELL
jgi:hypothetical protein